MFQSIKDMCEDPETFVCVLIDEVESLTAARKAAVSGMEPSDAIRVVNALLTQIDSLKRRRNVLVLSTSNITEAIDTAFVDRADMKQYIGLPSKKVIYAILSSIINELARCGLIQSSGNLIDWRGIELFAREDIIVSPSDRLYFLSGKSVGFSGRTIRKLPFLAHALHMRGGQEATLVTFLDALEAAIDDEFKNRSEMNSG
ncbi:Trip13 protein [Zopfochytrium polystomum]|nr:Trip13 protein [Zopfochytrium polystomum]